MSKAHYTEVRTKDRIHNGNVILGVSTPYSVEIMVDKSITIFVSGVPQNTFCLGDTAEYGSYILTYFGQIKHITNQTVTIQGPEKVYRLDLFNFCRRNHDFDAIVAEEKNAEEMDSL